MTKSAMAMVAAAGVVLANAAYPAGIRQGQNPLTMTLTRQTADQSSTTPPPTQTRTGANSWFIPAPDGSQCLQLPQAFFQIGTVNSPADYIRKSKSWMTKVGVSLVDFPDNGIMVAVETVVPTFPAAGPTYRLFFTSRNDCEDFNLNQNFTQGELR